MIQGGCPLGTGTGGPGHTIKGEFSQNGDHQILKHTPGVLSMARSMMPDSAGSQSALIMQHKAAHIDGQYAAFGKIIEGMDVVNKIAEAYTDYSDKPLEPRYEDCNCGRIINYILTAQSRTINLHLYPALNFYEYLDGE